MRTKATTQKPVVKRMMSRCFRNADLRVSIRQEAEHGERLPGRGALTLGGSRG